MKTAKPPAPPVRADHDNAQAEACFRLIRIDRIRPWPGNPRKTFDEAQLGELAASLRSQGMLQPMLVRPKDVERKTPVRLTSNHTVAEVSREPGFELADGERRFRAANLAGMDLVPCIVRDLTDREMLEIAVVSCEQRADVPALEKAEGYARLVEEHGVSVEDLAGRIGKSASTVRGLLKLRNLPERARKAVDAGELPPATAQLIARVPDKETREEFARLVLCGPAHGSLPMSYREAKQRLESEYMVELKGAPFKTGDKDLLPGVGSCRDCPLRVGNLAKSDPEAYQGVRADVCTSPACFRRKADAHRERLRQQANREGFQVMDQAAVRTLFTPGGDLQFGCGWGDMDAPAANDKKGRTNRELVGEVLRPYTKAAIDPTGKLRYLAPAKRIDQALEDLHPKKSRPGDKSVGGVVLRKCRQCGQLSAALTDGGQCPSCVGMAAPPEPAPTANHKTPAPVPAAPPQPRKPYAFEIQRKAASIAGQVLYDRLDEPHPEMCEPLRLLCLWAAEEADEEGDLLELADGLIVMPKLPEGPLADTISGESFLAPYRNWIGQATPEQLLGFLLKATGIRLLGRTGDSCQVSRQALLDWAELDWGHLHDQARRQLTGETPAEEKVAAADGASGPCHRCSRVTNLRCEGTDKCCGRYFCSECMCSHVCADAKEAAPALKGEPIGPLGLKAEDLTAANISGKFPDRAPSKPVSVKAVQVNGRPHTVHGSEHSLAGDSWDLLPLYESKAFIAKFPAMTMRVRLSPGPVETDEERRNYYFGVRVMVGKQEYVIGPRSEQRRLVNVTGNKEKARPR